MLTGAMPPSSSSGSSARRVHNTVELAVTSPEAMPSVKGLLENSRLEASGAIKGAVPNPSNVLSRKMRLCICLLFQFSELSLSSDNFRNYSIDLLKKFTHLLIMLTYIADASAERNYFNCCINVKE